MKQFIEFVPVALFVIVYFTFRDIYLATMVLMAGILAQVSYEYLTTRRVGKQTQVIFWIAMLAGGATLIFRNEAFLQWKPTLVNWFFAIALLAGHFLNRDNLLKKMLGEQIPLPNNAWRTLNFGWALGFFIAGALNLVVAYNFSLDFWVTYKLVGGIGITLVYMAITMIYLARSGYLSEEAMARNSRPDPADIQP